MKRLVSMFILFLFCGVAARAQTPRSQDLTAQILRCDSLLFNVGFNHCDLQQFEKLLSTDFEFYHDEAGVIHSKQEFIESVRKHICMNPSHSRRELVPGSLRVYPMKQGDSLYGALECGVHRFFEHDSLGHEHLSSTAQFSHLWIRGTTGWLLQRVFSYDHQSSDVTGSGQRDIDTTLLFHDRATTEQWLQSLHIPALGIGYIDGDTIQRITVYGRLTKEGAVAPPNTLFNVASLTKPVSALVVLKLIDQGKLGLDEPLYRYWTDPDVASDERVKKLTPRLILSHRSGFPNWRHDKLSFDYEPGTHYQYSGEGFEFLRRAVEAKFHRTLPSLANELLFTPLGMHDTHFTWDSTMDESRFARWHHANGELYHTPKNNKASSADDLMTTVEDYSRFVTAILKGDLLSDTLYREVIAKQTVIKKDKYFGLGWAVDENIGNGEFAINHGGDDIGVHTIVFILPKSHRALVIFTNSDTGTDCYITVLRSFLGDVADGIIRVETSSAK